MSDAPLVVGMSPCPNDTFMFHALVEGIVPWPGGVRPHFADIEALNRRALGPAPERLPVTKLSAAAFLRVRDDYAPLSAGAALGRGCGPLVVARPGRAAELASLAGRRVAIPGEGTTAYLLLRMFAPAVRAVPMTFDRILQATAAGEVDAGLIIHESRFTFGAHGLEAVADLGEVWEQATGLPLPLGVIAMRRGLGAARREAFSRALARSVELAFAEPSRSREWVRAHAQEMDPAVCQAHIDLYVNAYSRDLGDEGRAALGELVRRAAALEGEPG